MADNTLSQQRFSLLDSIDQLSNPDLNQSTVLQLYKTLNKDVDKQLEDATLYNENLASVLRKVALSQGKEDLREEEVTTLRQALFSALVVKEQRLTDQVNDEQKQSLPALGFAESMESVNNQIFKAYSEKKSKNRKFIESLVDRYSTKMHLSAVEKRQFREKFIDQIQKREQENNYRIYDVGVYIKEADSVVATIVPKQDYARNKAALIRQELELQVEQEEASRIEPSGAVYTREETEPKHVRIVESPHVQEQLFIRGIFSDQNDSSVQRAYEDLQTSHHQQEIYTELKRKIVSHEKVPVYAVPYVAIEAATVLIAKEKPHASSTQILEEAEEQARAFVGYRGNVENVATPTLIASIKEIINEREGVHGRQVAERDLRKFEIAPNGALLLQERQRWDLQNNIAVLLTQIDDNPTLKEAFKNVVGNSFFNEMTRSLREQANQNPNSMSGLLSIAAGGGKLLGDTVGSVSKSGSVTESSVQLPNIPVNNNPAYHFIMTSERLLLLSKENPGLYERLNKIIPKQPGAIPIPESGVQALFALAMISQDPKNPFDLKHYHTVLGSMIAGKDKSHPDVLLYSYLGKLLSIQEQYKGSPEKLHMATDAMVTKVYLMYLLSTNPDLASGSLKISFRNLVGRSFSLSSFAGLAEGSSLLSTVGSVGLRAGIRNAILSANPYVLAGNLLVSIGGKLTGLFKGLFGGKQDDSKRNWGLIGAIIMIPIAFLLMGNTSPTDIKRLDTPVLMDGVGHGTNTPSGQTGVDCAPGSTDPLCQFEQCKEENGRSCLAPSCGCITQGVNGTYSHVGYNAVDIGIGAGGQAGTCNGQLNPVVTSPIDARVIYVGVDSSYGNVVVIQSHTAEQYQLLFGHLASFAVSMGQEIKARDPIGRANNTGNSSGTHLHFERRDRSGLLAYNAAMAAAGVYRNGLPQTPAQNVRSLLPAGATCF